MAVCPFGMGCVHREERVLERFAFDAEHMGTTFGIVLYAEEESTARAAAEAAFQRIEAIEQRLSDYRGDSELNALGRRAVGEATDVSDDLFRVLLGAREVARASEGAFDVTVGPFVKLWRRARRLGELPAEERLAVAREAVSWRAVRLDEEDRTVTLERPGMQLDLGGIAKGYAAGEALEILRARGLERALVDAGGDVSLGEPPPQREAWRVALPESVDEEGIPRHFVALARRSIATSGDLYRFAILDGKRYSHILDPRTGLGLTERRVVTVIHEDGMLADALASALSVLGPEGGEKLRKAFPGMEFAVRLADGTLVCSDGFPARLERPATDS